MSLQDLPNFNSEKEQLLVNQALFTRNLNLCNEIVILDGLTGTGKTMFAPLLSSFQRMQNARFEYMFEYLCISVKNKKISSDASNSLLNLLADVKYYDGTISREVNFRPKDLSSVYKSSKSLKYFKQLFMADGQSVEQRIEKEKPILFLVTHQLLSCLKPARDAFGKRLKVVEMVRHPLYLVDHWASYINMHGSNARDFTIWLDYKGESLPWFAQGIEKIYLESSPYDRAIYSIDRLMNSVFQYFEPNDNTRDALLFIPFEKFVLDPLPYINRLETFLNAEMSFSTKKILKRQRVPRTSINAGPQKNIYKRYGLKKFNREISHQKDYQNRLSSIRELSSPEAFEILKQVGDKYEKLFGLWF